MADVLPRPGRRAVLRVGGRRASHSVQPAQLANSSLTVGATLGARYVDWAFLGPGPVGAELAPLVTASAAFLGIERDRWDELERTAGGAYQLGPRDAGWHGAPEQARLGFTASSALRYGPGVVRLVLPTLLDVAAHARAEQMLGIPFDAIVDLWWPK